MSLGTFEPVVAKRWVKWALSLFVCWHFYAIFTAVTAASTSVMHPAPLPAIQLSRSTYWYQHLLFMHNAYRFYVPDPGPVQTMWFRLEYEVEGLPGAPAVYWYEVPNRKDFFWRMSYQRHCSVTMLPIMMGPHPTKANELHPVSRILQESYVRHVAHLFPKHPALSEPNRLKTIDVYHVSRTTYPTGYDIQRNLTLEDPRWYRPTYYATFKPDGQREELLPTKRVLRESLPALLQSLQGNEFFSQLFPVTAEFLLYDYRFRIAAGVDSQTALRQLHPPTPMQQLLRLVPETLVIVEKEPVRAETYHQLVQTFHELCAARRGRRLLEDDLLPLGVRPRLEQSPLLLGTKPAVPESSKPGTTPKEMNTGSAGRSPNGK